MPSKSRLLLCDKRASAVLAILAIAFLPLAAWIAHLVALHPWDGIEWNLLTGQVVSVDPGGPASELLWPGDSIAAVNGVLPRLAPPLYRGLVPGDRVRFAVVRSGTESVVVVQLAEPPARVWVERLVPVFAACVSWALGVGVLAFGARDGSAILFFLFCLVFSTGLATGSVSFLGPLWMGSLFNLCLWWLFPLSIHLHLVFPERRLTSRWRYGLVGLYGVVALASMPYLVNGLSALRAFAWYPVLHLGARLALGAGFGGAALLMVWGYYHEASAAYRRGVRLVALSGATALMPFVALGLLPEVVFGHPLVPYWALFLLLLFIPAGYGYAILRFRLLRLDRFANRAMAHVLAFVLTASWVVVLRGWIGSRWTLDMQANALVDLAIVLAVGWSFAPTLRQVQRLMDRAFYGGWYEHQDVTEQVVRSLDQAADPAAALQSACDRLCSAMKLECTCLVFSDRVRLEGQPAHRHGHHGCDLLDGLDPASHRLPTTGALCRRLGHSSAVWDAAELRRALDGASLSDVERQLAGCERASLWAPLGEGEALLGVMGVGAKVGGDPFGQADRQAVGIIANHIGKTIRNLDLAAQLASRMSEVSALHRRLVRLREEERKQLARELHDRVIQGLVSLQFQIAHADGGSRLSLYESIGQLIGELRALCRGLRPPMLDSLGLVPAVRSHVRELARRSSMQIELDIVGDDTCELPENIALTLFRALQEALANVQKHAMAGRVTIELAIEADGIRLDVCDDGRGFVVPSSWGEFAARDSFGLIGLRERLDLVDGRIKVRSAPGEGTELWIDVPLARAERQEHESGAVDERVLTDRER